MEYRISHAQTPPKLDAGFDASCWQQSEIGCVNNFHARSGIHRPDVRFRMLYDNSGIYLKYAVKDRYVLARHTMFQEIVCRDSCVEFLAQPDSGIGYISFEMNCIGTLLCYHIIDPTRCDLASTGRHFKEYCPLSRTDLDGFAIRATLTEAIPEERIEPVEYEVSLAIPFEVFRRTTGAENPGSGTVWRGNFFKCADGCSHPHWSAWNPIGPELNFHQPEYFGRLVFA